jgi:formate dehydrogenase major subunit
MIRFILENKKYCRQYISDYTNAGFIINEGFGFKDGLFSGFDFETRTYDKSTWTFETDKNGNTKTDKTLSHPRSVFQALKNHFKRYDPETVSSITGTPLNKLVQIYEMYSSTGEKQKAGTVMYAMGWTQHTVGVQTIRAMAIIQLLLGNIGIAGGGVNALRGESNVQGSTDHCLLYHMWPGYLKTPRAWQTSMNKYNKANTPQNNNPLSANWWDNYPKYSVSLLKSYFKEHATYENEFGYH